MFPTNERIRQLSLGKYTIFVILLTTVTTVVRVSIGEVVYQFTKRQVAKFLNKTAPTKK